MTNKGDEREGNDNSNSDGNRRSPAGMTNKGNKQRGNDNSNSNDSNDDGRRRSPAGMTNKMGRSYLGTACASV